MDHATSNSATAQPGAQTDVYRNRLRYLQAIWNQFFDKEQEVYHEKVLKKVDKLLKRNENYCPTGAQDLWTDHRWQEFAEQNPGKTEPELLMIMDNFWSHEVCQEEKMMYHLDSWDSVCSLERRLQKLRRRG